MGCLFRLDSEINFKIQVCHREPLNLGVETCFRLRLCLTVDLDLFFCCFDPIMSADLMKVGNGFCFCLNSVCKLAIDIA
jgi:hypothetical protein